MERTRLVLPLIILSALCGLSAQEPAKPPDDAFQLGLVLKSARQYCARLEKAALDFICLEEVSETRRNSAPEKNERASNLPLYGFRFLQNCMGHVYEQMV